MSVVYERRSHRLEKRLLQRTPRPDMSHPGNIVESEKETNEEGGEWKWKKGY
jgi:hypothetical protein